MALFPPIVDSSMPAFAVTQNGNNYQGVVRIYFINPELNPSINRSGTETGNSDDIEQIQATVSYLSNNKNALNGVTDNSTYGVVNGIKFAQGSAIKYDNTKDQYYIQIANNATYNHCNWQPNVLYKVQLRFSTIRATNRTMMKQVENFSEWSTVCIIKPILIPENFQISNINSSTGVINSPFADFNIVYKAGNCTETLKQYRIKILNNNNLLLDSDWILVSNSKYNKEDNSLIIFKSLPFEFTTSYQVILMIKTENDYQAQVTYSNVHYVVPNNLYFSDNTYIEPFINEHENYVKIRIILHETANNDNSVLTAPYKFVLRRSSSKDNFNIWEDLFVQTVSSLDHRSYLYYDFTAQSGIIYRYLIQPINSSDQRGAIRKDKAALQEKGTLAEWENASLLQSVNNNMLMPTNQNPNPENDQLKVKQLKLKYDLQLSSFNINISENKTDTIGSKYPYIRRNGNMYYRSFPISGTIASEMDDVQFFISKNELNDGLTSLYDSFKSTNKYYTTQYDYTYQRKFRQAVQKFLYNGKPKLYKSMQEGNILVRLMDISLTPKQQLDRLIYTFSATAYEIDEPTLQNFQKYNIITRK